MREEDCVPRQPSRHILSRGQQGHTNNPWVQQRDVTKAGTSLRTRAEKEQKHGSERWCDTQESIRNSRHHS